VLGAALALSTAATAADWEFNPTLELGYLFDDNYRLTPPGTEIEVKGPLADAQLEMRARNPAGEFSFTPRIRANYFPDEPDVDTVDYFANLYWLRQGQRLKTELRADAAQQDVVNSEQPDATVPGDSGLGDPDIGDSGRVIVKNRRARASLLPSFEYELSERRALEFGGNFTDVNYDEDLPGFQVDYRNFDVYAGLVSRLTPTHSLTARVRGARYDIATQGDSTSYGAELQWDTRSVTDTRYFLRAGAQNVKFQDDTKETAWLAGAGLSLERGRNQLFADLTRSVGPSSAGIVITRDQLRVRWTRDLTPRLSFLTGLRGTHDEDVTRDSSYQPRSYATGEIGLLWRWQEDWSLRAAYDYTWQDFDDAVLEASDSSGALISVLYQPTQRRR
jgi:hypothetical protein